MSTWSAFISPLITTTLLQNGDAILHHRLNPSDKSYKCHDSRPSASRMALSTGEQRKSVARREFMRNAVVGIGAALTVSTSLTTRQCEAKTLNNAELAGTLAPILNLRDSLDYLRQDIEQGTNGDIRRVVRTLQKGIDLDRAIRKSVPALRSGDARDSARLHGREALEYLNQVIDYYDPTSRGKPPSDVLNFALKAVSKARDELDLLLVLFPGDAVSEARRLVNTT